VRWHVRYEEHLFRYGRIFATKWHLRYEENRLTMKKKSCTPISMSNSDLNFHPAFLIDLFSANNKTSALLGAVA